jgi:CxxC-x17-CxxC domain-containing protein
MAFQDRELTCRDCGGAFVFTAGEQEFYATKGLEHDPVRCPSCRATRKMMRPEDRDFAPAYGVYVSWGGRTPRQLHVASCAQCASMTEVPFRPRDDRPVYCSDCYGDLRRKQEAQEAAEATAAAERIATSGGKDEVALEGEGPSTPVDEEAAAALAATAVPAASTEDAGDSEDAGTTEAAAAE